MYLSFLPICVNTPFFLFCITFVGLDEIIGDTDLAKIARDLVTDWDSLTAYLGLNRPQREEIRRSYPGDYGKQKRECLEVWKEVKGNEATYRALIKAAEEAKAQNLADNLRSRLMMQQSALLSHPKSIYV